MRRLLVAIGLALGLVVIPDVAEARPGEPCALFVELYGGYWHVEGKCSNLNNYYLMRVGGRFCPLQDGDCFTVRTGWTNDNGVWRHIVRSAQYYKAIRGWLTVAAPDGTVLWTRVVYV